MCMQNLNFVAFPVPEIIGVPKKWVVPGYAHAPFSQKFLTGFCSDGPSEYTGIAILYYYQYQSTTTNPTTTVLPLLSITDEILYGCSRL